MQNTETPPRNGHVPLSELAGPHQFKDIGGAGDPTKEFTTPGDWEELLMRTVIKDNREAIAIAKLAAKLGRFKMSVGMKNLAHYLELKCSIGGRSGFMKLMGIVGALVPGYFDKSSKDIRQGMKKAGLGVKRSDEQ